MQISRSIIKSISFIVLASCSPKNETDIGRQLDAMNVSRGNIALCGNNQFGNVNFSQSCSEKVRADFNTATALLHSFEYVEAEKAFAKVIEADPECVMAYWGIAMSNYHPLWAPPTDDEFTKGEKTIALVRSRKISSPRESAYINAIATIFEDWKTTDLKTRSLNFVKAAQYVYNLFPEDNEAAIFYALALRSAADPADKTFSNQLKAGEILNGLFPNQPNHPGVAHYLIHNYDYPELATRGLDAARKYAAIAANSAHAQHMPSHIFTRLGLWDEAIQSNTNSMAAAKCYAENIGAKGHWDQELHGLDYVVYAYLQQGRIAEAKLNIDYLTEIDSVFPLTFVNAYTFAASPARFAIETKDWKAAANLELKPASFPWAKFQWQKGIHHFSKLIGSVHLNDLEKASQELKVLREIELFLKQSHKDYEANQTAIAIKASEGLLLWAQNRKGEAISIMQDAVAMEGATEKHSVTPGEVVPTLELLADMYFQDKQYEKAFETFSSNLKIRPGRYNSVYGAGRAAELAGRKEDAQKYYRQFVELTAKGDHSLPELNTALEFLKKHSL